VGATVTDPLVGRLVDGRYEVVSRIARGGMATVYLAVDRRLDRDVAIKVMHPHLADGASGSEFVARFRREARAAARLTHPGLVAVYDQGVDGETSYLTMEYVDGATLRRRLGERGALSVGESLRITEAVLDALAAAHRVALVHRDIKPENVLLASDGRIKLADFGLARAVTEVTATTTGTVLGTVAYLAPELVVRGDSDARTDVYACGVLLFEMLTGRQPFTGDTPIQVAFQHVNNDVPAPSDVVDWLPVEIDDLVRALAARDPADRPVDAAAALALVRRTRHELDPATLDRTADVPAAAPVLEPSDSEETEVERGALVPAVDDPSQALTTWLDTDDRPHGSTVALPIGLARAPEPAPPAVRRRRRRGWLGALLVVLLAVGGGVWWYMAAGPGAYTRVPHVSGLDASHASRAVESLGLHARTVEDFDPAATKGLVFKTDPGEGGRVRKGSTVTVTVSKGPQMTTVPGGLVGAMQADADAALKAAHLKVAYGEQQYDDHAKRGAVLTATLPDSSAADEGKSIPRDTVVTLVVSNGPAPVSVPSVVGSTVDDAKSALSGAGLKIAQTQAYSDTVPQGKVISQDPPADAQQHRGDTVTIQVSQGPELIALPDTYGKNVDTATQLLQSAGFQVKVTHPLGAHPWNLVTSQSPGGGDGKTAPKGSLITLAVV
jgi:eukaryotic-like serine/threonine-protein kinase